MSRIAERSCYVLAIGPVEMSAVRGVRPWLSVPARPPQAGLDGSSAKLPHQVTQRSAMRSTVFDVKCLGHHPL